MDYFNISELLLIGMRAGVMMYLPPIFSEDELEAIDPITNAEEIADGGAAMMAFAKMQFSEMSDTEAEKIQSALLKYCELDTFAMVMIYEHWKAELEKSPTFKNRNDQL